ncbi:hypothetical protein E2562_017093 [Oryza meyeriana var. granulata]|uniref:Uncharacterized protein n=1 Tax=Oryza meyeriana var. granulata TaxID=110450 RepID=A0A6G1F8Q1_9ORYZ|nr:hypothetical protein E2562_017093 [Oryza meyeriana var. granulata]
MVEPAGRSRAEAEPTGWGLEAGRRLPRWREVMAPALWRRIGDGGGAGRRHRRSPLLGGEGDGRGRDSVDLEETTRNLWRWPERTLV